MSTKQTKLVAPWNLKPGMRLAPLRYAPGHEPNGDRHARWDLGTITDVRKGHGVFTGGTVWHVTTDLGERQLYHGKRYGLGVEKAEVVL